MSVENRRRGEPVFDLPQPLVLLAAMLIGVQLLRDFLSAQNDFTLMAWFAFIPDRYLLEAGQPAYPGEWGAMVWTFLTHAFLHGSWMHLVFNTVMLVAVGRVVLMRIGSARFFILIALAAVSGAAVHLAVEWGSGAPMIGASGVVFGLLGAVLRFVFVPPWLPIPSTLGALAVPRVRGFLLALVAMNLVLVVFGSAPFGGDGATVAWAAHLGGFLAGWFVFPLLDPAQRR